ncbi:hypothetical protein LZ31DRAFT_77500 [Colletotrichum somersetense]|nr:hypothetical protein LZ31DRAFT_77500 [Colletotrichum somersetense]
MDNEPQGHLGPTKGASTSQTPVPHPCGEARIHAQAIFPVASLTLPSLLTLPPVLTSYALICCDICAVCLWRAACMERENPGCYSRV